VALRAGVRHIFSVGMPLSERSVGGLNNYRTVDTSFSQPFLERAEVFASYAAVAVTNIARYARATVEVTELREALESRATIEQAKGIIIAHERCTPEEAFELLVRISQNRNIKLRDVAAAIIERFTGHLPQEPPPFRASATGR
jgi:GAF domain-containing protein